MSHLKFLLNMHRIPYNIPCNTLLTCTIQEDGASSKRSMADMELELKAMKSDNEKWKNMCHAMEAKLLESDEGEGEEGQDEDEKEIESMMMNYDDSEDPLTEEERRIITRIETEVLKASKASSAVTATAAAAASASKSSSTVTSSTSKDSNRESHGVKIKVMEQEKEKEKKVAVIKDRKRPKDIKENPPSRGKNLTSKDKASSKKTKQKPKK